MIQQADITPYFTTVTQGDFTRLVAWERWLKYLAEHSWDHRYKAAPILGVFREVLDFELRWERVRWECFHQNKHFSEVWGVLRNWVLIDFDLKSILEMSRHLIIIKHLKMRCVSTVKKSSVEMPPQSNYVQMAAWLLVRIQQLLFTIGRCNHFCRGKQTCQFSGLWKQ